jgi:hypothetical protein
LEDFKQYKKYTKLLHEIIPLGRLESTVSNMMDYIIPKEKKAEQRGINLI